MLADWAINNNVYSGLEIQIIYLLFIYIKTIIPLIFYGFRQCSLVDSSSPTLRYLQGKQLCRKLPANSNQPVPASIRGY